MDIEQRIKNSPIHKNMKSILGILIVILISTSVCAEEFAIIYIDKRTEARIGDFPVKRTYYADAVEILNKDYSTKNIVIKLFLDIPKPEDTKLVTTLKKYGNVYSQSLAIDDENPCSNKISVKSLGKSQGEFYNFNCSWFPKKNVALAFKGIGFVNGVTDKDGIPTGFSLLNSINGKIYPSLPLILASDLLGKKIKYKNKRLFVGNNEVKLKKEASFSILSMPKTNKYKIYSFLDLLDKKISSKVLKDKTVFLFYNGKKHQPIKLLNGSTATQAEIIVWITDQLLKKIK